MQCLQVAEVLLAAATRPDLSLVKPLWPSLGVVHNRTRILHVTLVHVAPRFLRYLMRVLLQATDIPWGAVKLHLLSAQPIVAESAPQDLAATWPGAPGTSPFLGGGADVSPPCMQGGCSAGATSDHNGQCFA